jgi:hypothetical protein|tara:strand:+ start:5957 stop:6226 length:270 start_codon:yes stop_codon:yes gene_type:complete
MLLVEFFPDRRKTRIFTTWHAGCKVWDNRSKPPRQEATDMPDQTQSQRHIGKAVLVTILAAGALVLLNPQSSDAPHMGSGYMVQVVEIA